MIPPEKRNPPGGRVGFNRRTGQGRHGNDSTRDHGLPSNWRERLPAPDAYYRGAVVNLSRANSTGWAQGRCPFHEDKNASLSVNVTDPRGGWRCFAGCGGGDLVGFHMRRTGLDFNHAVRELIGVQR